MRDVLPAHTLRGRLRWTLPLVAFTSAVGLLAQASPVSAHPVASASTESSREGAHSTSSNYRDGRQLRYSPTPAPTPTPTVSVTPTPTKSVTPTPAVSVTPTPTKSASPTPTASAAPTTSTPPVSGARLFAASSLWNTVKSGLAFAAPADATLHGLSYGLNNGSYDHPTYFASSTDPMTTFHLGAGWGFPATTMTAPAPAGMKASSGGDLVMSILLSNGQLLDMYGVSGSGTNFSATYYGISDGVGGTGFGNASNLHAIGTTAIGSSQAGGTILARDIAAGSIPHALCMAFAYSVLGGSGTGGSSVNPAVSNDDGGGGGPVPEGGLLLIPAGTVKPAGFSAMGSALWDAAATYGVYVTDQAGGGPMFYGDGSSAVGNAFNSSDFSAVGKALRLAKTW
jgi:hypothetical protein